jgi:threonine synthase
MEYLSTRGHAAGEHFCDILLEGLAPDGGLYLPRSYPRIDDATLTRWRGLPYAELAFEILSLYIDDIPATDLRAICARTYTEKVFGTPQIVPLRRLVEGSTRCQGHRTGLPGGAVQRADPRLQGHGDATAGQPVRVRTGPSR